MRASEAVLWGCGTTATQHPSRLRSPHLLQPFAVFPPTHRSDSRLPRQPSHAAGKTKLQGFFVGAVMKESKGRANPAELNKILMQRLNAPPS